MSGTLYVVATPIGNLDDLSQRARLTLAAVDLIAAEDTRHTQRLLSHFGIKTPLLALHDHNEAQLVPQLVADLAGGRNVALVSDAGTPLVSDPGYRLVAAAHSAKIAVRSVPGPSAITAAVSVSGMATDRFCFEGFLPSKKAARRDALRALSRERRSMIFFEAVHRVAATLEDMIEAFGADRPAFLGRELTKLHEQNVCASLGELAEGLAGGAIVAKGEFVIVVAGAGEQPRRDIDVDRLLQQLADRVPARELARILAEATGQGRNELYRRLLELKKT